MREFFKSSKAMVMFALVFVIIIVAYNIYDTSVYSSYKNAYTTAKAQIYETELVNINTANVDLFCTLPGIKEATAEAIILYREEHGDFKTKEEIVNVKGIGENDYKRLSPLITVE
ncbi:MAG: helix-hairpin-helix domain-containing protein [Ruminococcus sp.]|nr:helix-hairpin-helix domain-containing protein [Ruminococcus sp.]